ncbi:MAG: hypothetical protein AABY22_20100, partial [Nanoarchaeota archaeon]
MEKIFLNDRINHFCLKKQWFSNKNIEYVYDFILLETKFLDNFDSVSFRERIFYIENDLTSPQICEFCGLRKLKFKFTLKFSKTCGDKECLSKIRSFYLRQFFNNLTMKQREELHRKIGNSNRGSLESRFGVERAKQI